MIKGYSGAGPSNTGSETPILRMHDDITPTLSTSTTPTLSIASSDDNRRPGLTISSARDDGYYTSGAYSARLPFPSQLMSTFIRVDTAYQGVKSQPFGSAAAGSYEQCDAPSVRDNACDTSQVWNLTIVITTEYDRREDSGAQVMEKTDATYD
jgi:hypothetical protein